MTIAYGIATVVFIALVMFWLVRAVVTFAIKEPKARLTVALQRSFFSLGLATGADMLLTVMICTAIGLFGFMIGFPIAALAVMSYMLLQCVQWLYVTTEASRERFSKLLPDAAAHGEPA